ncbi:UDP-N-acetylmuramoyl-L-alanine--D-glutamate ligase [Brevibacillus borstelensis]|jgi:UDP-N-acetylmuramoylalanine--D-glutamate ligase|uniref:UDP-N-acetylmuramoylalanine--D-glutamate ligase n=1 Tax=Brevibacillus borstelensis AK1 TaxID=1300222 RepID=M8E5D4_9BACL|nr:UDP-N-acetylmuramoyl-L-alanine--D-glutamate ligase [Brevibacillus borstelensis]EMT54496.1 UDP-N-acetylmuramoylalanine--D-glutamate ligase [Brevibacillus borstelensis AK1]KKX54399.1 UDP-N-acetylmuramoyl-L-alanyl-D-glutamate synthetase [Brevibacillus borstelensis cifa_chp40]MCC0563285.1 UDP-N-acetylmuramoyl-L-alanine--D-glutamate ligase [Brevibacillus borstelensis]MCM3471242.1 UDP-N-acetylmuramoyl-L-alanine--D-glutamate ligase [Brevibacillus borstelensis]MCM3557707.1 UDP-N-acetylmuramoyl-L-al
MNNYQNQHVVVLGMAKSGVAVAKLLHRFGAHVVVNDQKPREEAAGADELEALGIEVICGGHPDDLIHPGVALVVKNPGIRYEAAPVAKAIELGIPVVTEVELAYQVSQAPIIGITGSNGKTTTTTLVGLILQEAGIDALTGGNIGTVLCGLAQEARPDQWLVAELSSFQLMGTLSFKPKIGVLMNIYPAHLDYHHTMDEYKAAKWKLFANQTSDDIAILPYDQPDAWPADEALRASVYYFSKQQPVPRGVCVDNGVIVYVDAAGEREEILPLDRLSVAHLDNALAAALVGKLAGAGSEAIAKVLSSFAGVEHRMEFVGTVAGVKYYNDSKATNSEAASRALQALSEPTIWICGGLDRGVTFHDLIPVMQKNVKAVIAFGETAPILLARAKEAGINRLIHVDTVEKAVIAASEAAVPGDVVLLSPACASWDMFPSFEVRGSMFKDVVHRLKTSLA